MTLFPALEQHIELFSADTISPARQAVLQPLAAYIRHKKLHEAPIRLNFICTHNSRRSHLAQIWAQTMAYYCGIKNVFCYSGGTEATALFPQVAETLTQQGFWVCQLAAAANPVYAIKYAADEAPVIGFSKVYQHEINPRGQFAAVMTCNSANESCPVVLGAEARFAIQYDDPKAFDGTALQAEKYAARSLQIAQEMWWVFKNV